MRSNGPILHGSPPEVTNTLLPRWRLVHEGRSRKAWLAKSYALWCGGKENFIGGGLHETGAANPVYSPVANDLAYAARISRLRIPLLSYMCAKCTFTVDGEILSTRAISLFFKPWHSRSRTSRSLDVKCTRPIADSAIARAGPRLRAATLRNSSSTRRTGEV